MTELAIDESQAPRSYRISSRPSIGDLAGLLIVALIIAVPIALSAKDIGGALAFLGPRSDGDLSWPQWALVQLGLGTVAVVVGAAITAVLLLVILVVINLLAPGSTVWRLDGSGLCGTSGVGPFKRLRLRFTPFEAIAEIRRSTDAVSLFVWRNGRSAYECDIASKLADADAAHLSTLLNDDLAAARAEWASQGLVTHPRAVDLGR